LSLTIPAFINALHVPPLLLVPLIVRDRQRVNWTGVLCKQDTFQSLSLAASVMALVAGLADYAKKIITCALNLYVACIPTGYYRQRMPITRKLRYQKYLYSTMVYSLMTQNLGLLFIEINSFLKIFYIYTAISFSINDVLLSGRVVVAHLKGWVLQSSLQH
jgi:hypothetical protein